MKKTITIICSLALLWICNNQRPKLLVSSTSIPQLPSHWQSVDSANAVILGKNSYTRDGKSNTDYAIIVNLAAGGGIRLLDSIKTANTCSPEFNSYSVIDSSGNSFWNLFKSSRSFAMANLQFFSYTGPQTDSAQVCYPIYYNRKYISQGCADGTCRNDQKLAKRIIIFSDTINIQDYSGSTPCSNYAIPTSANAAVVGNHPLANRDSSKYVPRTYLAKQGTNLILYTSKKAREEDIYSILQEEFNVAGSNIIMFDGGGSTQMICKDISYIKSSDNRLVPSAIEIYSAN